MHFLTFDALQSVIFGDVTFEICVTNLRNSIEAGSCTDGQEIPHRLRGPNLHLRYLTILPPVPVLRHFSLVHTTIY
jgi:hypothetical protein